MHEDEIAKIVLDHSFHVHRQLGPGLLESVYETVLSYELLNDGLEVRTQVSIPFYWKYLQFDNGSRTDIIVENKVNSGDQICRENLSNSPQTTTHLPKLNRIQTRFGVKLQ